MKHFKFLQQSLLLLTLSGIAQFAWAIPEGIVATVTEYGKEYRVSATIKKTGVRAFRSSGEIKSETVYELHFSLNGRDRILGIPESVVGDATRIDNYFKARPETRWQVSRTTGGVTQGKYLGVDLKLEVNAKGQVTSVDPMAGMGIQDFKREGGDPHKDPVRNPDTGELETIEYRKPLRLLGLDSEGAPRFANFHGEFKFPDLSTVNLKGQRFLLDFGTHPNDPKKQLFYPVYVDRFEDGKAVLIGPHDLQKLERAQAGQRVKIAYFAVPKNMLRLAPAGVAGDLLKQNAGVAFIDDAAEMAAKGDPVDILLRANRWEGGESEVEAGSRIEESLANFKVSQHPSHLSRQTNPSSGHSSCPFRDVKI